MICNIMLGCEESCVVPLWHFNKQQIITLHYTSCSMSNSLDTLLESISKTFENFVGMVSRIATTSEGETLNIWILNTIIFPFIGSSSNMHMSPHLRLWSTTKYFHPPLSEYSELSLPNHVIVHALLSLSKRVTSSVYLLRCRDANRLGKLYPQHKTMNGLSNILYKNKLFIDELILQWEEMHNFKHEEIWNSKREWLLPIWIHDKHLNGTSIWWWRDWSYWKLLHLWMLFEFQYGNVSILSKNHPR